MFKIHDLIGGRSFFNYFISPTKELKNYLWCRQILIITLTKLIRELTVCGID